MCGIFGYIGKENAVPIVVNGLKRLEYRGYDSWGMAVPNKDRILIYKTVGKIGDKKDFDFLPKSNIAIGHTRWATHGGVTDVNAHPHLSSDGSFALAQNGIVENSVIIKKELLSKGYKFHSQTDTEVIVRLIEDKYKKSEDFYEAVRESFLSLGGRNTIIVLNNETGEIIAARNGSPLVIGLKGKGDIIFSSDALSFSDIVSKMIVVDNGQIVVSSRGELFLYDAKSGIAKDIKVESVDIDDYKADMEGHDHFMHKEIYEQPSVIEAVVAQDKNKLMSFARKIKRASSVYVIGSGTAGVAASQISFYLRKHAGIKAVSLIGGDSKEYLDLFKKGDVILAPSQSGETADVLEILEKAKNKKVKIASYVNMPGSTMSRISDYPFMAGAGPEVCVMSTKIFVSQIAWGYLLAKTVSGKYDEGVLNLKKTAVAMSSFLSDQRNDIVMKNFGKILLDNNDIYLMAKGQNAEIAREGMIKLIEGTYKHAHSIPAGDLKHYAITLIEKGTPVIAIVSDDESKTDMESAINQVKSRGATVFGVSDDIFDGFDRYIEMPKLKETSAIINIIPLQLLAYHLTVLLGNNVDKPRNIAKSVTVK